MNHAKAEPSSVTVAQPTKGPGYKGPIPTFTGPWAAEFAQAYASTTSTLDHRILKTNEITDQDYAAVGSTFISCLAAQGYSAKLGSTVDTYSVQNRGTSNAAIQAQEQAVNVCSTPFQAVAELRYAMLQNPQHLDLNTLIVACLLKKKLVDPGYTVSKYKAELQSQSFSFDANTPSVKSCLSNPLGANLSQPAS